MTSLTAAKRLSRHYLVNSGYETPLPPSPLSDPWWLEVAASFTARIEAIRMEEAEPICPACGSSTPRVIEQKFCPSCSRMLPVSRFSSHKGRYDGLHYQCRPCEAARKKRYRTRIALRALGRAS